MKIYRISHNIHSPEFKKWFGDWEDSAALTSKRKEPSSFAVDEEQKPKVMYHGTTKDFKEFEVGLEGTNSNVFGSWKTKRHAIFFTPDPNHANAFTSVGGGTQGGNIRPVYLDIKSPLMFTDGVDEETLNEFSKMGINRRWLMNFGWEHLDGEDGKLLVEAAKSLGYDGIIFNDVNPETGEFSETWAVFSPEQIKSVYEAI